MKTTMNMFGAIALPVALLLGCAFTASAFDPACGPGRSSLNLKTIGCASSLDNVTFAGGILTATGHLRAANSGKGPGTISSIVANLQVRDGTDWITIASAVAASGACGGTATTCSGAFTNAEGASLIVNPQPPVTVPAFSGAACGANTADLTYTATFAAPGSAQVRVGKPVRIEMLVTFDGAVSGCSRADFTCGSGACGFNRTIVVRFGFPVE